MEENLILLKKSGLETDTFIWKFTVLVTARIKIYKGNVEYVSLAWQFTQKKTYRRQKKSVPSKEKI